MAKWKKRTSTLDRKTSPVEPRSTVLSVAISALAVETGSAEVDVGVIILFGFVLSFYVLQSVDMHSAYLAPLIGWALAVMGVSLVQFRTGGVVEIATTRSIDANFAALAGFGAILLAGVRAFVVL